MELEGKISLVLPARSGTSERTGNSWKSQEYVVDYFYYPNQVFASKVVMRAFGEEKIDKMNLQAGDEVKIRYHFDAHQSGERWFNEIRIDGVKFIGASAYKNETKAPEQPAQAVNEQPAVSEPPQQTNAPQAQENAQNQADYGLPF